MSEEPFDPVPAQKAAVEQLAMEIPQIAKATWTVYSAYVEVGFTPDQALTLTAALAFNSGDGESSE